MEEKGDVLEAKKRDHKIEITDVAIDKVPCVEYKEIPKEHYEVIQVLAKQVLRLSRDRNNYPSLSKVSLQDVWLFLKYVAVKMIVVVTNLGAIDYIVKTDNYNRLEALKLYDEALEMERGSHDLKGKQNAAIYFLRNFKRTGIIYQD